MKKHFSAAMTALLLANLVLAANPANDGTGKKNAESKISKVTVYIDGSQITRAAHTSLSAGNTDILFGNLSPYLDKSSISMEAKGGFTVMSITHQINHLNEQKKKVEAEQLEKRKEEFAKQIEDEENMKSVYEEGVDLLKKNQLVNSPHTDLKAADLKAVMDLHEEKLMELKKTILNYERTIKKLQDTIDHIDAQLKEVNAAQSTSTSELVVTVNAKQATEADFTFSYYVGYSGWFPSYDLRVDDISQPMKIAYRANVHQSSGEDWKDVKLTLSNGEPKANNTVPYLSTWYIANGSGLNAGPLYTGSGPLAGRVPDPNVREVKGRVFDEHREAIPFATIVLQGTTVGTTTDADGNYSLQLPYGKNYLKVSYIGYKQQVVPVFASNIDIRLEAEVKQLSEVTMSLYKVPLAAKARNISDDKPQNIVNIPTSDVYSPTTYSYEIELPYTIPDDGKTYTVDIKEQGIPADYLYKAVPKMDKEAFLTALVTGWEDYNLLDGEANLYFEGTYIGQTLLSTSTAEDTLQISLGRDKSVVVNRTKLKDLSKRTFLGDKKIATRAFEISVRNNKRQAINIVVEDQFPVPTQTDITVDKQEYKDASLDATTGKLTWNLQIAQATEKKVGLKYAVKYPKDYHFALE